MKKYINKNYPHVLHGGDYNPDQWINSPEILQEDMRLFQLANCNEMTVGIFSWTALEPSENNFNFSFLDDALDQIYKNKGRVILATPSGARPAWMAKKYPEILRTNNRGEKEIFGQRHNHCFTSPIYREKVAIINEKLAERYKNHPAIIAWHVSNEYSGECYCPLCKNAFREWLKQKYKTLDCLNEQWWTGFWSHTFTSWDEINPQSPLGDRALHGLYIDWKRFVTDQTADFLKAETEPLRRITPDIPITTNYINMNYGLDYRKISKNLDFVSLDLYPRWKNNEKGDIEEAIKNGFSLDLTRTYKHKPFLLMESTPSCVNWHEYNKLKRPGMHELSSLQAISHGSDSVQYFQWRKNRGGCEKFHGAVVDHVGNENTRVFKDVSNLGKRLKTLDEIVGTNTISKVGLMFEWCNQWALDNSQGFNKNDKKYLKTVQSFYAPLWKRSINTDIIGYDDNFSNYDVIFAPMLYMITESLEKKLERFVNLGGTLICTYMTGMVNENDLCYLGGFPAGELKDVFGIWNEEIDTLYPEDKNSVKLCDGNCYEAIDYCEIIHVKKAKILGKYCSDFYKDMPAFTLNNYGKGKAYYIAFRDNGIFTDKIIDDILKQQNIKGCFDTLLPEGVTARSRTDDKNEYIFLQNFTVKEYDLKTNRQYLNYDDGKIIKDIIHIKPYETLILKQVLDIKY